MTTQSLFHESLSDAIKECIGACGGMKLVAAKLWPEKSPDGAHRLLLSCLNEDRPERLSPEQLMLIFRMSRDRGCHVGVSYLLRELGYADPVPVEPKDEVAELQRQYIESARKMAYMADRIERLGQPAPALRGVA